MPPSLGPEFTAVTPAPAVQTVRRHGVAAAAARAITAHVDRRRAAPPFDRGGDGVAQGREAPPPRQRTLDRTVVATEAGVSVQILASASDAENEVVYSTDGFRTYTTLGLANAGGTALALDLAAGDRLEFAIVNGSGTLLRAGPATRNADGLVHARATQDGVDRVSFAFEDQAGGGDLDYDDARIQVTHVRLADPAADGVTRATVASTDPDDGGAARAAALAARQAALDQTYQARRAALAGVPPASDLRTAATQESVERLRQLLNSVYLPAAARTPPRSTRAVVAPQVVPVETASASPARIDNRTRLGLEPRRTRGP